MILSSRLAELQHVPPAWKFCAVQSQERFDRENAQRADRRKWKTTARPRKTLPGSPDRGHEKNKRARGTKPGPPARTERKWKCSGAPFMGLRGRCRLPSCICSSRMLSSCLAAPMGATSWVCEPASLSQKVTNAPINPNLDSSSKTDLETRGKYREVKRNLSKRALTQRKARAREEPSPGPPASETDAGPPGHQPRGGAPARPRLSRGQEGPT